MKTKLQHLNNAHCAEIVELFQEACELARIKPTTRQASKFRNKKGAAYKKRGVAIARLVHRRMKADESK